MCITLPRETDRHASRNVCHRLGCPQRLVISTLIALLTCAGLGGCSIARSAELYLLAKNNELNLPKSARDLHLAPLHATGTPFVSRTYEAKATPPEALAAARKQLEAKGWRFERVCPQVHHFHPDGQTLLLRQWDYALYLSADVPDWAKLQPGHCWVEMKIDSEHPWDWPLVYARTGAYQLCGGAPWLAWLF